MADTAVAEQTPRVSVKHRALQILADNEDGLTTAELARVLGHKQQGRTFKTVKALRDDEGLITTKDVQRDPEKKNKSKVHTLSAKGKKALPKLDAEHAAKGDEAAAKATAKANKAAEKAAAKSADSNGGNAENGEASEWPEESSE